MKAANLLLIFLLSLCFVYSGCKSEEQKSDNPVEEAVEKTEEMHQEMEQKLEKAAPAKLAAELWGLIHTEEYKEHWKMMPGKKAFAEAGDGKLVTTYVNDTALNAIEKGEVLPEGSILVTESYNLEKTLESIKVQARIPGFDEKKDDWFTVTYNPDGRPLNYN